MKIDDCIRVVLDGSYGAGAYALYCRDTVALSPAGAALQEINRQKLRQYNAEHPQTAEQGHAEADALADAGERFDEMA